MSDKLDLSAPEVQEAIKAAVEAATKPLIEKRDELLGEVKKLRKDSAIKPEDFERLEAERDELQAKLTQANKDLKTATATAEKATKALTDEQGFTTRLLADNGLSDALVKVGVNNPAHLKAVKAMLAGQVQIVADGDTRVAKVGDKALADYVKEWAASDEGKHFVSAAQNNGGGAHGGAGGSAGKTIKQSDFDQKKPKERAELMANGYQVVE